MFRITCRQTPNKHLAWFTSSRDKTKMSDNNEDDEYHDTEMQKFKSLAEAMEEAVRENWKLITAGADKEKIEQVKQRQIDLLGSAKLYERINQNLKLTKFEAYFAREQFKLFSWREDFFHEQFPDGSWFTSGSDDSHSFDTVPFQITQHFESVVALSTSQRSSDVKIYFENDECRAARARNLFDSNTVMYMDNFLEPESLEDHGLRFSDALHIIAAVFPAQPLKLEHLAMKKTLETKVPLDEIPRELQEKAARGMFSFCEQVEPFIYDQGKEVLEILKNKFENSI